MLGYAWKPGKASRNSTRGVSESVRVVILSLFLAILLQVPLLSMNSKVHWKSRDGFVVSPRAREAGAPPEFNRVEQSRVVEQQRFQPTSIAHYAFIKYSAYRHSSRTFFVVGISSKVLVDRDEKRVVHTCEWHPANGSRRNEVHTELGDYVVANASMLYVEFDENGMTYVPAIVNCTFDEDVGADGGGGLLVIKVSLTYHRYERNVPAIVLDEQKGDADSFTRPPKEKPHKYAFCGPPMYNHVNAEWIRAWMVYHNYIWNGDALFLFYNVGGLHDGDRHLFDDFVAAGLLTITDSVHYYTIYPSWLYHQVLYIQDCLFRARFLADYVFFFDFDEFLQIRAPETIGSLLEKHKDLPWLTVGNIPADFGRCSAPATSGQQYAVERMLWHDQLPECMHEDEDPWMCIGAIGRRKWISNTKYTLLGGVHRAALPGDGGINMNASEARVIHFHGVLSPASRLCNVLVEEKDYGSLSNLDRDDAISRTFAAAKLFPIKRHHLP